MNAPARPRVRQLAREGTDLIAATPAERGVGNEAGLFVLAEVIDNDPTTAGGRSTHCSASSVWASSPLPCSCPTRTAAPGSSSGRPGGEGCRRAPAWWR
ncbi:hypothetical protein ACSNOK_24535 [Streptomyces sp. URMC 126]|uniref:hypothetical protein n=1 Tax=Streptomyces sp. URMC 126 TaxID=3423401 RepID=UPI003F1DC1E3